MLVNHFLQNIKMGQNLEEIVGWYWQDTSRSEEVKRKRKKIYMTIRDGSVRDHKSKKFRDGNSKTNPESKF